MPTREEVIEALRVVEDPELGMDIVELGLLYDVDVQEPNVHVTFSLTSMGCPVGPLLEQQIRETVESMDGVQEVDTELTWDPPWTPDKMSDDAKFILRLRVSPQSRTRQEPSAGDPEDDLPELAALSR